MAALRAELEREHALWSLAMLRLPVGWERWELAKPLVHEHLRLSMRIRVPIGLMPAWYRTLWWDPTQIDGRAEIEEVNSAFVRLHGSRPGSTELDTAYSIEMMPFLENVLAGTIGDAS